MLDKIAAKARALLRRKQMNILERLEKLQDTKYRVFHSKLCPGKDNVLGVRVPAQKKLAKEFAEENWQEILNGPIGYWAEEKNVYGLVIAYAPLTMKQQLKYLQKFVPQIDSWAVCDTVCSSLKSFQKNRDMGWEFLQPYLKKRQAYQVRFGVVMLLDHYSTGEYIDRVLECYEDIKMKDYYVQMAVAWGISVAYIKFPERTKKFLQEADLDDFTYNKAIQKCLESFRVSEKDKHILKKMKRT